MSYRSALLGCGPRAKGHAQAYKFVENGSLVALCDFNEDRLHSFGDGFQIEKRYSDLDEMLEKEKPDVVHVVTDPTLRVPLLTRLCEANVPGIIVEKPICIGAEDYKALRTLEASPTKIAVNHQLRHHPMILQMLEDVKSGAIGKVCCIDASCLLPMSGQGVHVLDLMFAFNDYTPVQTVFGGCSGYDDINGTHPSPTTASWVITFENGMRALLTAGQGAPQFEEGPTWAHKRIAVYGTKGFLHWRMNAWERSGPGGVLLQGTKDYAQEDVQGQAQHTEALFRWLGDKALPHPCRLSVALDQWQVMLAGYLSAIEKRPVSFPFDPPADLLDRYKSYAGVSVNS